MLTVTRGVILRRLAPASASCRGYKETTSDGGWKNETHAGSSTEVCFCLEPNGLNNSWGFYRAKIKNFALPGDKLHCRAMNMSASRFR